VFKTKDNGTLTHQGLFVGVKHLLALFLVILCPPLLDAFGCVAEGVAYLVGVKHLLALLFVIL